MLSCRKFGLPVLCFEKDQTANTIRNFPKKKIVMAEPVEMPIVGPLWVGDTNREKLLEAWEGILDKAGACITTGSRLEMIEKKDGRFQVTVSGKPHACDKVILALGNRGVPRKLGIPGEDGANVFLQPAGSGRIFRQHGHGRRRRGLGHRSRPGPAAERLPRHPAGPRRRFSQGQGQEPGAHRAGERRGPDPRLLQQPAAGDRRRLHHVLSAAARRTGKKPTRSSSWSAANCPLRCLEKHRHRASSK